MTIKHSPVKNTLFLLLALFYETFFIFALYEHLTSTASYKDSSFFFFSLVMTILGLLFIIRCIRRLSVHSTIISINQKEITYCFSGLLSAQTYRIPIRQIVRARYNQEIDESEISLWMREDFHDYQDFQRPRHHIYAYPDSRLVSIVFKRRRLKELENHGLDQLIYRYQQGEVFADQPATVSDQSQAVEQTDNDSPFF